MTGQGLKLFERLDVATRQVMYRCSLRHWDPDATDAEIDALVSWGLPDQGDKIKALMFMIFGSGAEVPKTVESAAADAEVPEEEDGGGESGNGESVVAASSPDAPEESATPSVAEPSPGAESASSSDAGTDSPGGTSDR